MDSTTRIKRASRPFRWAIGKFLRKRICDACGGRLEVVWLETPLPNRRWEIGPTGIHLDWSSGRFAVSVGYTCTVCGSGTSWSGKPVHPGDDRAEWDAAWRSRTLRRLPPGATLDWAPALGPGWGRPEEATIAADPAEFAAGMRLRAEICPVCGDRARGWGRVAVTVYPNRPDGIGIGLGTWAHASCLERCTVAPGPSPIPW